MNPATVQLAVEHFADFLLKYFVALAAVGALAMALIELGKALFDWRMRFQARATTLWILLDTQPKEAAPAFGQLLHLCTGVPLKSASRAAQELLESKGRLPGFVRVHPRDEYAVFALDMERMAGHFEDAVDVVLNSPQQYKALFNFVTRGAKSDDRKLWRTLAHERRPANGQSLPDEGLVKQRADVYARLHQVTKRKLDAFQLYTSTRWVNTVQLWANILGVGILGAAFVYVRPQDLQQKWILYVGMTLLGGVLAPVAKDIVVALQQVRQRV